MAGWKELDSLSRAAVVAAVAAVVLLVVPPLSVLTAAVAAILSALALRSARSSGAATRTQGICLAASLGLIVVVVVGSALYAGANP